MLRSHHRGDRATRLLLIALLAGAALGLTQCRVNGDRITGVGQRRAQTVQTAECQAACRERYDACRQEEEDRYRLALDACDLLPSADRRVCRDREKDRHKETLQACQENLRLCREECRYVEGTGTGGR